MGQISVKTYAANGSLLNDNQQVERLNTVLSVRMTLDFDGLGSLLETNEDDDRLITEWEEGFEHFAEDDLTDDPENCDDTGEVWEEGMDFLSDEDLD